MDQTKRKVVSTLLCRDLHEPILVQHAHIPDISGPIFGQTIQYILA